MKAEPSDLRSQAGAWEPGVQDITYYTLLTYTLLTMPQTIIERYRRTGLHFVEDLGNGIELEMVLIKGGTFQMGTKDEEIERLAEEFGNEDYFRWERPQHQVTVPTFFMGKYQVTQEQWRTVAALPQVETELEPEPSYFKGDNLPVEQVSWYDAVEFCARLSNHTQRKYSLPSEAQWEYACRAGTTTRFHFGDKITTDLANYAPEDSSGSEEIYLQQTTPVGSFGIANAFGLYDMHGNVDEWCLDDWHDNYEGAPGDSSAWLDENDNLSQRQGNAVLRGGSWVSNPEDCRSASRDNTDRAARVVSDAYVGFRVVCGVGRAFQ